MTNPTEPIAQGDTVYLKSGGPAMTVVVVESTGQCHVTWGSEHAPGMSRDSFPAACLTRKRPTRINA